MNGATADGIRLSAQVNRVPSMRVALDAREEKRFRGLVEESVMMDLHEHPMVLPENTDDFVEYLRRGKYEWGYDAAKHGGWTVIATGNGFRGMVNSPELSYIAFNDLVDEVGMMIVDAGKRDDVLLVGRATDVTRAKQQGRVGLLPTVEHLAIGDVLHRVDVLYALGVRMAGLTYNLQSAAGSGLRARHDAGLSEFGNEVVRRMNDVGMAIDLSHAGFRTAMDAIERSRTPILFSHNAAYSLRPTWRTRRDEELLACAAKGGLVAITAVPNSLSDDPSQDIRCVLDHYDYMVKLVGVDHVAVGTDTLIGDHVGFHCKMLGSDRATLPAAYLDGLESPADGQNIIRGLITRGYSDDEVRKIVGGNALEFLRRVAG